MFFIELRSMYGDIVSHWSSQHHWGQLATDRFPKESQEPSNQIFYLSPVQFHKEWDNTAELHPWDSSPQDKTPDSAAACYDLELTKTNITFSGT